MRNVLILLFATGLAGCATTSELSQVYIGMHKNEVKKIVGSPVSIDRGREVGCDYERWKYAGFTWIEFCNGRIYNWFSSGPF